MQCLMLNNYFSCIYIYVKFEFEHMWLSFGNMHRNGCCSLGWLLKNFFSGPVSYISNGLPPIRFENNELNLGAIVSVLYLTRNCKSTKLKGSQIKFLKNPAQLYRQIQWSFALFFVWRVHPARASKEYIQTSDIQDGCPVAWPVTLGELHDNDRLQGPWTRKNSIREWKH